MVVTQGKQQILDTELLRREAARGWDTGSP